MIQRWICWWTSVWFTVVTSFIGKSEGTVGLVVGLTAGSGAEGNGAELVQLMWNQ